jgi:hypothetical protein
MKCFDAGELILKIEDKIEEKKIRIVHISDTHEKHSSYINKIPGTIHILIKRG